jgi:hypothetical protein
MAYIKEFAADANSGEIVAERVVPNVTPAMKARLLQINKYETTSHVNNAFGYVHSDRGPGGWTYVMVGKLIAAKLIEFRPIDSGFRIHLTALGAEIAGVEKMLKIRAKSVIKLCSETVNSDLEFPKGVSLVNVFKTLGYFIYDADTLDKIHKDLVKVDKRVNGPGVEDGHDYEGFPGGCERFGCDEVCIDPKIIDAAVKAGFSFSLGKLVVIDTMNRQVDITEPLVNFAKELKS